MEINVNNTFFTGKFLLHLPSVDSTNNYAKNHIAKSSPIDGTVILADEQFAGRGQSGNSWASDAHKNLTFSIIYQTTFLLATEQFYLNMAVSLGIQYAVSCMLRIQQEEIRSLQPAQQQTVTIKWPNDIYAGDRKIAGILIENTISGVHLKYSVIGIGLNVNQEKFPESIRATGLKVITGNEFDRNKILNHILESVEMYFLLLKERKFDRLKKEYLDNLYRYNCISAYKKGETVLEGKIIDVDETGHLIMETAHGAERFGFKEIQFIF